MDLNVIVTRAKWDYATQVYTPDRVSIVSMGDAIQRQQHRRQNGGAVQAVDERTTVIYWEDHLKRKFRETFEVDCPAVETQLPVPSLRPEPSHPRSRFTRDLGTCLGDPVHATVVVNAIEANWHAMTILRSAFERAGTDPQTDRSAAADAWRLLEAGTFPDEWA